MVPKSREVNYKRMERHLVMVPIYTVSIPIISTLDLKGQVLSYPQYLIYG